jgi:DNA helicase-2/ATP-dependent DNA helicase PcrA
MERTFLRAESRAPASLSRFQPHPVWRVARFPFPTGVTGANIAGMSRESFLKVPPERGGHTIDYARQLNPEQYAAVTSAGGPTLVIAGAGSGKTRTLTYRVAYLLEQGVAPDRILLLTFTNKAAREMMRRVADLLGGEFADLWGGTFHSIGARVLRRHAEAIGYRRGFTILDREDSETLIKACVAEAGIDPATNDFLKPGELAEVFGFAENARKSVTDYLLPADYSPARKEQIAQIAAQYVKRKRAANVMDFDDLIARWLETMQQHPEIGELYQRRFQHVLVDEYQDTNQLQCDLVDLLAAQHKNVMVVGDDAQSIYSWRGANIQNILTFPQRYSGTQVYTIATNYRSTPQILDLANAAIAPNEEQFPKELVAERSARLANKPLRVACADAQIQAQFVAQRVLQLADEGMALRSMAVLYRSHFHALELQLHLTRCGIPFSISSGIRFFEQAHVKDVAAYLKFIFNPADELSFRRVVRLLPGVGQKAAERLWSQFQSTWSARALDAWDPEGLDAAAGQSGSSAMTSAPLAAALQQCASVVPKKAMVAWTNLAITISQLESETSRQNPSRMIYTILEAGYEDYLHDNFANAAQREEDLQQLSGFATGFENLEEFLTQLALLADIEAEDSGPGAQEEDRVRLSTIHQAKGLEFDVVFLIMLCDGMFPTSRARDSLPLLEEERRLFYVALTRARNELYLSFPLTRKLRGSETERCRESTFLKGLPPELMGHHELMHHG